MKIPKGRPSASEYTGRCGKWGEEMLMLLEVDRYFLFDETHLLTFIYLLINKW
jgi:hypothetical protein